MKLYEAAMIYATRAHNGQVRKGTNIPYITHPLAVADIVRAQGGSEEQIAGALLHDVVEDGGGLDALSEIRTKFGEAVGDIVFACSDSTVQPKPEWWERKMRYIAHIAEISPAALLVSLADKVHNAEAIESDLARDGLSVFEVFTTGKEGTLWYYRALVTSFRERGMQMNLVNRLDRTVTRIEALAKEKDPKSSQIQIADNLFVKYLGESDPLVLLRDKVYPVQRIEKGWYRIFDETGEDFVYPSEAFEVAAMGCGDLNNPEWARALWAKIGASSEEELKLWCRSFQTPYEDFITFPLYKFRPWTHEKK